MTKRIVICRSCDGPGETLATQLQKQLNDWEIVLHDCLSACAEPVSVAVQATAKATYVFAGLTDADWPDVLAFATVFDNSPDGWIADARSIGRLRFCLRTRVPAL